MGKTSVLYQMHRYIDPVYLPVLVDIQGMTLEGMSGFLWELAYTIQRGLRRPHNIQLPRPKRQDYQQDPRHEFPQIFLPQVQEVIGEVGKKRPARASRSAKTILVGMP